MRTSLSQTLSTLLLSLLISMSINLSLAIQQTSSTRFIKQSCTTTSYARLCYASLSRYAPEVKNSPKSLATKALTVALATAQSTSQTMIRLSKHQGLRPREASALSVCMTAVINSASQLQRSIDEMSRLSSARTEMQASDIQTWTSTALTYAGNCKDAFAGRSMNGQVKKIVDSASWRLTQFTSIALALVNNSYASSGKANHGNHP